MAILFSTTAVAADLTGVPRKPFVDVAETVTIVWTASCFLPNRLEPKRFNLKSAPTPWYRNGIQFTTIGGQKVIITTGSSCMFEKVPKR